MPKLDSIKITTKEIEDWLQEVLSKAELQQIPDIIANPQYKNPIYRYGLDRQELAKEKIPDDIVDRIYRSLYVYSIGFYEIIKLIS